MLNFRTRLLLELRAHIALAGATLMLFGPLLVFTPERKITVKNRILRAVVKGAQAKETRYVSFAIFLVILGCQVHL